MLKKGIILIENIRNKKNPYRGTAVNIIAYQIKMILNKGG